MSELETVSESLGSGSKFEDSSRSTETISSDEGNIDSDDDLKHYERALREIARGDCYTCMICTIEMDYTCKMFACKKCYRIFDHDCIQEWAAKSVSKTIDNTWKCPNCSFVSRAVPKANRPTCWCGKVVNPEPNMLDVNSCGQTCRAKSCIHKCQHPCHLGPHPPCNRTIDIHCKCGKNTKQIFCDRLTKFKTKKSERPHFSCREPCGLPLACGVHKCKRTCHSGLCGECPEMIRIPENNPNNLQIKCYCGLSSKSEMNCSEIHITPDKLYSHISKDNKWIGVFKCENVRDVQYSCKQHSFREGCKNSTTADATKQCPLSPKTLKTCPCGKSELDKLSTPRKSCTDLIPTCDSRCDKKLSCGKHTCPFTCHNGPCMDPCLQIDMKSCACNVKKFLAPCQFNQESKCNTKCEALMSCLKHRCINKCCPDKPAADIRKKRFMTQADKLDESLVEAGHICLKDCNRKLLCGIHNCSRKCHPGKCPPCLESSSNDLVCPCGKTVVEAPVRCGVSLPPCLFPCIKVVENSYPCGHKPPPHSCHPETEPCPPCVVTVDKPCACGKVDLAKGLCFQNVTSCGQVCGKKLSNCHHKCQMMCHLPGMCQKACNQICGKTRQNCEHSCRKKCHGESDCPDDPCQVPVTVFCSCGRRKEGRKCGATLKVGSQKDSILLTCDEECLKFQRHQQLKDAFGINDVTENVVNDLTHYFELMNKVTTYEELNLPYDEPVLAVYNKQTRWCDQIATVLDEFVNSRGKQSLHFKPMKAPQRQFIIGLAQSYNLYAEAQDYEPKRSVYAKKTSETRIPGIKLEDALELYLSFKKLESERKQQLFASKNTIEYMNIKVPVSDSKMKIENTGFLLTNLQNGTTADDLKLAFEGMIKPTLVKDPQFSVLPDINNGLIYPSDYESVTEAVERDLQMLVGHMNFYVIDHFMADEVILCNAADYLTTKEGTVDSEPYLMENENILADDI